MILIDLLIYIGIGSALFFGLTGVGIIFDCKKNKEKFKKILFDLFGACWQLPFVFMALCIDGIYVSLKYLSVCTPLNQEDLIIIAISCIIGLVRWMFLIKEYMVQSTK